MGLLSKDEETILEGSASLIEKARGARADKAQAAWSKATEYLEKHKAKVRERREELAGRYVAIGYGLEEVNDRAGALRSWMTALEVDPRHVSAFQALAHAYEAAGNPSDAQRYLDEAVALNPQSPDAIEGKASFLVRRGKGGDAVDLFERLHKLQPEEMKWVIELCTLDGKNARWWLERAKIAHKLKERPEALKAAAKAAELSPEDPIPRVYTSLLLDEGGDPKAALTSVEEAVALAPSHKEANRQRARLLTKIGDEDAALDAWKKMTRLAPDESRGFSEAASLLYRKGKFEEASLHYDTACHLAPSDQQLWRSNAAVKEAMGKLPEALRALDGAEAAGASDAPLFKRKGQVLLKLGRADQAYEQAGHAVRIDPDDRETYEIMLDALDKASPRRNEDFLAVTELLLKLDPVHERAAVEKARSLGNLARWGASAEAAGAGLARNGTSLTLWRLKLAAHKSLGEREQVAACADSILRIDPKDSSAALDRGEALFELARFSEALDAYNGLLMLDPTHAYAGSRRGQSLQRLNRHREAVDAFDHVLSKDKENVSVRRLKAESLAALGKRREAINEMDLAIGTDPKNVKLWIFKASLHQQGGESDAAKRCLAKAIEVDPKNAEALAQRAALLLSRGLAKDALADLEALTGAHAGNADGWLLYGEALEAVDRVDDARRAIERALAIHNRNATALRQGAWLEMRAKRPREACRYLERASEVDPQDLNTILDLGEAYDAAGDPEKALDAYRRAEKILPGDRDLAGLMKGVLRQLNRDAEVERVCTELLVKDPNDADALFDLAVARRNRGNFDGALEAVGRLLALRGNDVHVLNEYGYLLSKLGRFKEAVEAFSKALESDPHAEHPMVNKGLALRHLGEHREALACFRAASDIAPQEPTNWNLLGLAYDSLEMHEKAVEAFDRGLKLVPAHAGLLNNKGKSLFRTNNLEGAVACFRAATAADPGDANAHFNLGNALHRLGRLDEAERPLERARELDRSSHDVLLALGRLKMDKGDFSGALSVFDAAVKADPKYREAWDNRGICLDNLDRFEEAVVAYERSLGIDDGHYRTWFNKGLAYYSLKRWDEALPCFDRAHKINPKHEASLEKRTECQDLIKEREVERYARKILDFEFTHRKRPTREEAFKIAGVPFQHLDDTLTYLSGEPKLDLFHISRQELLDLEKASAAVLKYIMTPEAASRGDPIKVTLAELLHHFPETSIRRSKRILKYLEEVDRLKIDAKKTITTELERAVQQAVKIPPDRRNLREISVTLDAGILRSKRILQILQSLERELEVPAHEITIRSIKDAGWKVREGADEFGAGGEERAGRARPKLREEEPPFEYDVKGAEPVHAAPSVARDFATYAGGTAPDPAAGPPAARPRLYCSACKIRGASHRHNECGEFLCDTCLERFNQVDHITAGIKLLCPVCEQPIRDLGEVTAKWDKL